MLDKLAAIEERYDQIEAQLQDPDVVQDPSALQRLGKERASLEEIVGVIKEYRKCLEDLSDAESLLSDEEMRDLAQAEIQHLKVRSEELEHNLKLKLLATDPNDDKSVIIEIRQAAGGQEAALFAGELFRMYTRYAERRKWKYDLVEMEESDLGGQPRRVLHRRGRRLQPAQARERRSSSPEGARHRERWPDSHLDDHRGGLAGCGGRRGGNPLGRP